MLAFGKSESSSRQSSVSHHTVNVHSTDLDPVSG